MPVISPLLRLALGGATGIVALISMIRLIGGGFPGSMLMAGMFAALAMVPWVVYVGLRARHSRLTPRTSAPVGLLCLAGLLLAWWGTTGPVLALACSLAGFLIIWLHDLPPRRTGAPRLVSVDELNDPES